MQFEINELLLAVSVFALIIALITLIRVSISSTEIKILRAENTALLNQLSNSFAQNQKNSIDSLTASMDMLNTNIDQKLYHIQQDNNEKLEKIRITVDEKLHETLEKRLGESFKIVSERLEQVYRGLGEMQTLATGVGDLKKVLSNVKTRGVWGEVQLENILDQLMLKTHFEKNVQVVDGSGERVEFALKIPTHDGEDSFLWLPIDAKFPLDTYQRLNESQDNGDPTVIAKEVKLLESYVKLQAKTISEKYIDSRYTTDFALMFLPVEGLYAEILRIPGLAEFIQNNYRVVVTSPTTLAAILSSIQLGFKTIAIERRSKEVWRVLAIVKTEFAKFADILMKTRQKLDQASKIIEDVEVRSRVIQRKLKDVESIDIEAPANKDLTEISSEDLA